MDVSHPFIDDWSLSNMDGCLIYPNKQMSVYVWMLHTMDEWHLSIHEGGVTLTQRGNAEMMNVNMQNPSKIIQKVWGCQAKEIITFFNSCEQLGVVDVLWSNYYSHSKHGQHKILMFYLEAILESILSIIRHVYTHGWKSIHKKYKACQCKCKHTKGKPRPSKQSKR